MPGDEWCATPVGESFARDSVVPATPLIWLRKPIFAGGSVAVAPQARCELERRREPRSFLIFILNFSRFFMFVVNFEGRQSTGNSATGD